jgi:glutathione S-transferase
LIYLAQKYDRHKWFSDDPMIMSKICQWLFTSTHDIQMGLAAARVYYLLGRQLDINLATQRAHSLLKTIDAYLGDKKTDKTWLESDRPTIADVACFPYIALSHDAKIDLAAYPHTLAWVERFKQLPNFIPLPTMLVNP